MTNNEDDLSIFRDAVKGVRPIKDDHAETGKKPKNVLQAALRKKKASERLSSTIIDGLSDQFVIDTEPEEFLYWARSGVQDSQMRRLKAGQIPFEGSIDLHGMTVEQARKLLWEFLESARLHEVRCVRITHGKALRKDRKKPLLKSHVNTWLRQHEQVLGFCSCHPKHGGTGAVYVLLRRLMLDGRDE